MLKRVILAIPILVLGLSVSIAHASPLTLNLLSAEHTTFVRVSPWDPITQVMGTPDSRTTTSGDPLTDAMMLTATIVRPGTQLGAQSAADLLSVSTDTSSVPWGPVHSSGATAKTVIDFAPAVSGLGTFGFDFIQSGISIWSEGLISLVDMTAQQMVWSYGWTFQGGAGPTLPAFLQSIGGQPGQPATLDLLTALSATSRYRLTMTTSTSANFDGQSSKIQMRGVQVAVPEPSLLVLVGIGLAGAAARRRRRVNQVSK